MEKPRTGILLALMVALLGASTTWSLNPVNDQSEVPEMLPTGEPSSQGVEPLDDRGLREDLGLSDEQVKQLRSLRAENLKQRIRAGAELKIKRLELEEFLAADEPDRALIDSKLAELNNTQAAMTRMRVDHRLALRNLLTPEQRSKLQDRMRKHMRRGMRDRRGPGGFGPRSPRRGPGFGPGPDRGAPPDFDEPLEEE